MNHSQTISVVIPNYNYGRFIAETIEGVLAQTHPIHEIIVVDDGSTDDSIEVLKKFGERVSVIEQRNQGVGAARNTGARKSSGEFIAFLDADDVWLPNKIAAQMKVFADETVGLVSCGMREFNSKTGATLGFFRSDEFEWRANDILLRKYPIIVSGSAIAVRRTTFDEAGGFDARKEMHPVEDWEFCYRMALIAKVACLPSPLVEYRNHGANGHLKTPQMERALLLAGEKIFAAAAPDVRVLRGECYGVIHSILAGDYFQAGNYRKFLQHSASGLRADPRTATRFFGFPLRVLRRLTASSES